MGIYRPSKNKYFHAKSSWRLSVLTERALTIEVGILFQYFKTRIEKKDFLRRHRNGLCRTLKG